MLWLVPCGLLAQNRDILDGAPRTSIYVETALAGNQGLENCDWYASAGDLLEKPADTRFGKGCQVEIRIRGIINREGALRFTELVSRLESLEYRPAAIVLDSRGGDADAAISMARLIRTNGLFRQVPVEARISAGYQSVCFSACVVVFSAAYNHTLEFNINGNPDLPSRIGIHGPGQFDRRTGDYDSSSTNREILRVSRRLKDYFRDIGVEERLVDDMFAVPFDEIRLLNEDELKSYGLYD